ncbi:Lsr2 dimerization domain-containing protein [Corynebacterium sp. AOP34-AQ2-28]
MARKEITQFFDDLDNTLLSTEGVNAVEFSHVGSAYVLDLSADNAQKFADTAAARYTTANLSYRATNPRHCLTLLNTHSTTLRPL